ncbi:MAG: HAD family phosphatase [Planctomycetota bacterium]
MNTPEDPIFRITEQPPQPIQGVALDMDGLLFDTEPVYFEVLDQLLIRRGLRYTPDLQQKMMGQVGVAAARTLLDHHRLDEDPAELMAECARDYGLRIKMGVDDRPGLDSLLKRLRESELPFGVATSSYREFFDTLFAERDWSRELAFVITGDDVDRGKPDPQIYLKASEAMAIDSSSMLVLEDSQNGIRSAVAANAIAVAVPNEETLTHDFQGAAAVVKSLDTPWLLDWLR